MRCHPTKRKLKKDSKLSDKYNIIDAYHIVAGVGVNSHMLDMLKIERSRYVELQSLIRIPLSDKLPKDSWKTIEQHL